MKFALPRSLSYILMLIFTAVNPVTIYAASINIEDIVQDNQIRGKVTDLGGVQNYKVIVYVHTDQWYIHPYASGDEGRSWATINANGEWSISTVKREFNANRVGALVVDEDTAKKAPSKTESIESIPNKGMIIYDRGQMENNNWYGRL